MSRRSAVLVLALSVPLALPAASPAATAADVAESRRLYAEAVAAYEAGDAATFAARMVAASDLRPSHPTLLVQRAVGLAATGDDTAALAALERVAAMGMAYTIADEPAFAALAESPRFAAVVAAMARNAEPAGTAARSFALAERGLIPEGLACRPDGGFFLGSVREREVYAVDVATDGTATTRRFATLPFGAFGMAVDPARGALWTVSSAVPPMRGHCAAVAGRGALVELDLATGQIRRSVAAPAVGEHVFGDLVLAADGIVWWSDSATPAIYRWPPALGDTAAADDDTTTVAPWLELPGLLSPQGLALLTDSDGAATTLVLADYSLGLQAVDLATREVRLLPPPADATLLGIDGVYAVGERTLVAVQNGTTPPRVLRLELDAAVTRVSRVEVVVAAHPDLDDPTLGAVCGDTFHFVANAQWPLYGEDGAPARPDELRGAVVLAVPVGAAAP